jgi:hypothetical protein
MSIPSAGVVVPRSSLLITMGLDRDLSASWV